MSALIRYFLSKGKKVAGYDKTPSGLTEQLNYEGAVIHYEDNVDLIPDDFTDPAKTLVVYTPAVPEDHSELCYFRGNGFEVTSVPVYWVRLPTVAGDCVWPVRMARQRRPRWSPTC